MNSKQRLVLAIAVSVVVVLSIEVMRIAFLEAFKVPSSSMENTVLIGDHVLVNKAAYALANPLTENPLIPIKDPERGDVVVLRYPEDPSRKFIKRIVGMPGDQFEIRKRQVYVNGKALDEPYKIHKSEFDNDLVGLMSEDVEKVEVPEGFYFVLGDNRDNSKDSRAWGFVSSKYIVGKVTTVYLSFDPESGKLRTDRIGKSVR